jgi:hypothetical protein
MRPELRGAHAPGGRSVRPAPLGADRGLPGGVGPPLRMVGVVSRGVGPVRKDPVGRFEGVRPPRSRPGGLPQGGPTGHLAPRGLPQGGSNRLSRGPATLSRGVSPFFCGAGGGVWKGRTALADGGGRSRGGRTALAESEVARGRHLGGNLRGAWIPDSSMRPRAPAGTAASARLRRARAASGSSTETASRSASHNTCCGAPSSDRAGSSAPACRHSRTLPSAPSFGW